MQKIRSKKSSEFLKLVKQAFAINNRPLPWSKAISAGICSALPVFIGALTGYLQYGLITGLGGLAFLYMFNEPYALRAKKIFFAALGLSISAGLGTLLSQNPFLAAAVVGLIGAVAVFIFGAYQFKGPSAIFFVLVFLINANMVEEPSLTFFHAALVLVGGLLAWIMAMWGWWFRPYSAETAAVKKEYGELAVLLESVGSSNFYEARIKTWATIKATETTLTFGYSTWTESAQFVRLALLHKQVKLIYSVVVEQFVDNKQKLPVEAVGHILMIASSIGTAGGDSFSVAPQPEKGKDNELVQQIRKAHEILIGPIDKKNRAIGLKSEPFQKFFMGSFNKNSVVFFASIRFGIILAIAALIANFLNVTPSYWIPLSCAAVMSGTTVISTFNRAIQRTVGTAVGILIAAVILSLHPDGIFIAVVIFVLTILTELAIVLNYAVAAFFITPNALMIAESTSQIGDLSYFASARLIDVLIGSAIGLIGTLLMGKRHASSLLPRLMAKTIRSQQRFIGMLFSPYSQNYGQNEPVEQWKMRSNLNSLKLVFETAHGELSSNQQALASMQQVFFALEHLGFSLENAAQKNRQTLSALQLGQLYLVFEMLANTAEDKWLFSEQPVPEIPGFPDLERGINDLQETVKSSRITLIE